MAAGADIMSLSSDVINCLVIVVCKVAVRVVWQKPSLIVGLGCFFGCDTKGTMRWDGELDCVPLLTSADPNWIPCLAGFDYEFAHVATLSGFIRLGHRGDGGRFDDGRFRP